MQSAEHVANRIIDLDERAERIRVRAHEDAEAVRLDAQSRISGEKVELEKRIAAKIADIEARAAHSREGEIARVRKEYADQAEVVERTSPGKIRRVVDMILLRIKGSAG
jgi:hypothetical protein